MSELVTRISDNVGIAPDTAEKALGMMLGFCSAKPMTAR